MHGESSSPPASEDSAVGSISSLATSTIHGTSATNDTNDQNVSTNQRIDLNSQQQEQQNQTTFSKNFTVESDELVLAAKQMRSNNVTLISRSVRTVLSCFDDLDIRRFESKKDYLINFVSNGVNRCTTVLRPVSILWPDSYEKMVDQLAILDAFLLNTAFREQPVNWMLKRGLTTVPNCSQCRDKMIIKHENNVVRWQCQKTQACKNYFMPVQRPSFFSNYENVGLDKLLFSIYFWSTCTPGEELHDRMNIDSKVLDDIWRRIQNVCRTALEKSYPRHRLTDVFETNPNVQLDPIDLISIKLNNLFVVCAKHPDSNLVRLGLYIPSVSAYSFVDLTESWFAHGSRIRISESKFLDLAKRRTDLKVLFVPRMEMLTKNGQYHRDSAFGYLICQLTHVLKDFDSSTLSRENLKLVLAEIQWRELYGSTPFDAFTNIINHMAQYGETSSWYSEPSLPIDGEESLYKPDDQIGAYLEGSDEIWAEKYFYATIDPIDATGKVICRYTEAPKLEEPPLPDVRIRCHDCKIRYEPFDFSMHVIAHVEKNRKNIDNIDSNSSKFECKHCFKDIERNQMQTHSAIFRSHYQGLLYGCRICCIKMTDRASFLQHMRRIHFEHETPYRCPSCLFASSFQRDVFIHFQEEHRHSMIILCPLCLRSFTVAKPNLMNSSKMDVLSQTVYNHISEHYVLSKQFTCSNCCLCFLDQDKLNSHRKLHHNVLEIRPSKQVKLQPFVLTPNEEKFCIKALPMELFIANKRPNLTVDSLARKAHRNTKRKNKEKPAQNGFDLRRAAFLSSSDSSSSDSESVNGGGEAECDSDNRKHTGTQPDNDLASLPSTSDDESYHTANEDGVIHVRGLRAAKKFLVGGGPDLKISKTRPSINQPSKQDKLEASLSSKRLIDYLSKMKRVDGVSPNQSVILTPSGSPAKCCECLRLVTADHFVSTIKCKSCKYTTHCPRAATRHNLLKHDDAI